MPYVGGASLKTRGDRPEEARTLDASATVGPMPRRSGPPLARLRGQPSEIEQSTFWSASDSCQTKRMNMVMSGP